MNAADAVSLFNLAPSDLTNPDGSVAFDRLREGTAEIADTMIAPVGIIVGDEAVSLEAMSLMVHSAESALPFNEPFDGMVAIELCTVPPPITQCS